MTVEAYQNIFDRREVWEETNVLISPCNPKTYNLIGKEAHKRVTIEEYFSNFGPVETSDTVEEGRLASTVWPDDAVDAILLDLQIQFIYSS